ncbi:hypothetical protein [Aequorivita flava]|uniref:Uncharacterized protein n=1 Tax=Aequorivita flava TaxID=3114371 RepID=A0AB35YZ04_9FLAO
MKAVFLVLYMAILIGCSKKDDTGEQFVFDLAVNLSIKNEAGDDMLDPNNPNSYKLNDIKTYHLIDGEEVWAIADNVISQNNEGAFIFTTFVNYEGNYEYPITYIDWDETDRDTIKAEIYRTERQIRVIKIWYNEELKWDVENGGGPEFTIIK